MALLLRTILVGCLLSSAAAAQSVRGSGSSFCYTVMAKWTQAYAKATGVEVAYFPIGSSGGLREIRQDLVDFAVSEVPLNDAQLLRDGLVQFPLLIGAVVPVVNIPHVGPGELRLTGPLLADIYMGKIANWNDKQIATLNPGLTLPDLPIQVVHRTEGSGTTYVWADYLSKVSPEWRAKVGEGPLLRWPLGHGAKGNGDVASKAMRLPGGIGYLDYPYAMAHKLAFASVRNEAGQFVMPDGASFAAATEGVDWRAEEGFTVSLTNVPAAGAYPIMAVSFALIHRRPSDPKRLPATIAFLRWTVEHGGELAAAQSYLPVPPFLVRSIQTSWNPEPAR